MWRCHWRQRCGGRWPSAEMLGLAAGGDSRVWGRREEMLGFGGGGFAEPTKWDWGRGRRC
jgi:hypothetical protein